MATVKPFAAIRFSEEKAGKIETLACPPYDIVSDEQRAALIEKNEYNMIKLELPKGENPYEEASDTFKLWQEKGVMVQDMEEGLYIYEEEFLDNVDKGEKKILRGFIARVKVEDFKNGVVLPHEETLSKAKEDRFNLMKATNCNFSQIYSLYIDEERTTDKKLDNICESTAPRYEFNDGLVTHRLWVVNDELTIASVCDDFQDRKLYIADGHHRYETAINYRNYCAENNIYAPDAGYVMMMLVNMAHEGLVVHPTHRLVRDMENFDGDKLLNATKEYFITEEIEGIENAEKVLKEKYEENKCACAFYEGGESFTLLTLKDRRVMDEVLPEKSLASRNLDVSVLHNLILERLLGIDKENMAKQKNLTYTRSTDEAFEAVKRGKANCTFILNPTRVREIGEVAAAGEKMPQKSTYFYPKIITGLVINPLY